MDRKVRIMANTSLHNCRRMRISPQLYKFSSSDDLLKNMVYTEHRNIFYQLYKRMIYWLVVWIWSVKVFNKPLARPPSPPPGDRGWIIGAV